MQTEDPVSSNELHSYALDMIRQVAAAPPTSRLGRIRSKAKSRMGETSFVKLSPEDVKILADVEPAEKRELAPEPEKTLPKTVAMSPWTDQDPEDTNPPDYAL